MGLFEPNDNLDGKSSEIYLILLHKKADCDLGSNKWEQTNSGHYSFIPKETSENSFNLGKGK